MKSKSAKRSIALLLGAMIILIYSGCCRSIACDCIGQIIYVSYQSTTNEPCPNEVDGGFSVDVYSSVTNFRLDSNLYSNSNSCDIYIQYSTDQYWVITADSLGISDTLRASNVVLQEGSNDCCDCGPTIQSGDFSLNGETANVPEILRLY